MLAHFIISVAFLLSLFKGVLATFSSSEIDVFKRTPDTRTLFPLSKRTLSLRTRDIQRRALHPRSEVVLSYGEDFHSGQQHVFVVDITLICYESTPVLLLENFEDLISSITCSTDLVTIAFSDNSDFDYARDAWSTLENFILISNHPENGCNPSDERGVYMVKEIHWNPLGSTVEFLGKPLPLPDAAKRISVDFGHITRENFHETLTRRQTTPQEIADDKKDTTANFHPNSTISLDTTFSPRAVLWPLSSDVELDGGNNGESQLDVQVTCIDCFVSGELIYRGHFDQDFTDEDGINIHLQWAWVEVEVTKAIKSQLKLEFYLALESKEWEISLLPAPISFSPFQIPGVISLGPEFDYSLITALSLGSAEFNFTYGVTVDIPLNSIARFDFVQTNNSYSKGWDKTEVKQIPFFINSLDGDLALSVNVTTQPSVGFKITMLGGAISAGPSIDFAAPRLLIAADELHNVTANCSTLGPNDYEYYEDAFQFSTAWELGVSISISAEADFSLLPAISASFSKNLYTHSFAPDLTCRVLGNGTKTGELLPASSVNPQVDIAKVQSVVDNTGVLPTGVNPDLLATYSALPTAVKNAVDAAQAGATNVRAMSGVAILGLLAGVAVLAGML